MSPSDRATDGITTRESLAALAYFALYLAFSFWSPGSEMRNYLTLVAGPLVMVVEPLVIAGVGQGNGGNAIAGKKQ